MSTQLPHYLEPAGKPQKAIVRSGCYRPERADEHSRSDEPAVLIIAENAQGSSHLAHRIEGYGCKCNFATSYQEAFSLLGKQPFNLVLSASRLHDASMLPLIDLLEGSRVTLFYFQAVEEGCWWLPALRSGKKCFGSSAFRPSEFAASLQQIIMEIRTRIRVKAIEIQPPSAPAPLKAVLGR